MDPQGAPRAGRAGVIAFLDQLALDVDSAGGVPAGSISRRPHMYAISRVVVVLPLVPVTEIAIAVRSLSRTRIGWSSAAFVAAAGSKVSRELIRQLLAGSQVEERLADHQRERSPAPAERNRDVIEVVHDPCHDLGKRLFCLLVQPGNCSLGGGRQVRAAAKPGDQNLARFSPLEDQLDLDRRLEHKEIGPSRSRNSASCIETSTIPSECRFE